MVEEVRRESVPTFLREEVGGEKGGDEKEPVDT